MALEGDLIGDMLERVRRLAAGRIGDAALLEVVRLARLDWGGRRYYIARRPPESRQAHARAQKVRR